jgi:hypothetical protein
MQGYVTIMRLPSDCGIACINPTLAFLELHVTQSTASALLNIPVFEGKNSTIPLYPTTGSSA